MTHAGPVCRRAPILCALLIVGAGCSSEVSRSPVSPSASGQSAASAQAATTNERACWGQATQVFARMGVMGAHASEQPTPRIGLRNLARALYEAGTLPNDSLAALGAFVSAELGLSIDACS